MADEKTTPKRPDHSRLKVTKEELDASGLSLRDYMNKQLGLKRRDGSAPESAPAKASSSKAGPSATPFAGSQMGPGSSATKGMESEKPREDFASIKNMLSDRRARIARDNAALESGMKKGGKVKKMANGGSASSRGDGIASKGKTRGKMC
jgi:hypothetical protein